MKTNRPGTSKYFIALIPPSPVLEEVWKWKNYYKEKFNSKAALRSPPHLTLHMPFEWKTLKEERLINALSQFSTGCHSFEIMLNGFDCFPPRVIFIKVAENEKLRLLQSRLVQFCKTELNLFKANHKEQPFHPHVTVAFRDLKKSLFPQAWAEVVNQKLDQDFMANHLTLLKHNGKSWDIFKSFMFLSQPEGI